MLEPATPGLPVYSGVFSANLEYCKLIGFSSFPCRNALCSGLWKCSYTMVLQSPRSFTVFMLNFLAWKYYSRIVHVWISHCTGCEVWFLTGNPPPPPLTMPSSALGRKKLPCGFSKLVEVLLPAPCFPQAGHVSCICEVLKTPASTAPCRGSVFPFDQVGETGLFQLGWPCC